MDAIQKNLLEQVAELHDVPEGAYNIRANGKAAARNTTANIDIVSKEDKDGIDIIIKPGTKNESVHIPVVLSESGLNETVYNDFIIGDDCDVTIVAGHPQLRGAEFGALRDPLLPCGQARPGALCGAPLRRGRRYGGEHHESHHRGGDG